MKSKLQKNLESLKRDRAIIGRILKMVFQNYPIHMLVVIVSIIVASLASALGAVFTQRLIDYYILPMAASANPAYGPFIKALGLLAFIYLAGTIASFLTVRLMVPVAQGVIKKFREDIFAKMMELSVSWFDAHAHGDVMSIYTNDIDIMHQMLASSIVTFIRTSVTIVVVFSAMIYLSPLLTLLVLVTFFLIAGTGQRIALKSSRHYRIQQEALGAANGYIEEMVSGLKEVKVFNYEQRANMVFAGLNDTLYQESRRARRYSNILMPITTNIGNVQYVLIAIIGGTIAINGYAALSLGTIAAFLQLSRSFIRPVNELAQEMNNIVMALAGAKRVFALADTPLEKDSGYITLEDTADGLKWCFPDGQLQDVKAAIRFEHVSFSYDGETDVLHDINFDVHPGERVAFAGATGAGKTTIMNLLARFYEVDRGRILFDGINIKDIKKGSLRQALATVLQDAHLFSTTVRENIRYGRIDATDQEVEEAAKLAYADSFIRRLTDGYDTLISEAGEALSEGQRQLLTIARAEIAHAPVLILDEATSSIDTHTESLVEKGLDQLMSGRTVFLIAHRLSTIRNADCIYVMDQGRIIESGNHEELIKKKGIYWQLYTGKLELA